MQYEIYCIHNIYLQFFVKSLNIMRYSGFNFRSHFIKSVDNIKMEELYLHYD